MIARRAALLAAVLLALVIVFQIALVLGAPWGRLTQGGFADGPLSVEGRALALVSALISAFFAVGLLGRVGVGPLVDRWRAATAASWVCLAYSLLGLIMNSLSSSVAEREVWTPVCLVLLVCAGATLWGTQRRRPTAK